MLLIECVIEYYDVSYEQAAKIVETYRQKGELAKLLEIVGYIE